MLEKNTTKDKTSPPAIDPRIYRSRTLAFFAMQQLQYTKYIIRMTASARPPPTMSRDLRS
ncbi:hypothetical protein DSUL_80079 [Desulfovibrionales bacterium]